MDNKFYTDDFERLLKERSDEFRMYPSKRVWHSIYNDLHPGRKWPSIAMSLLLIIAVLYIGYLNTDMGNSGGQATAAITDAKATANNGSGMYLNTALTKDANGSTGTPGNSNIQPANNNTFDFITDANIATTNTTLPDADNVTVINNFASTKTIPASFNRSAAANTISGSSNNNTITAVNANEGGRLTGYNAGVRISSSSSNITRPSTAKRSNITNTPATVPAEFNNIEHKSFVTSDISKADPKKINTPSNINTVNEKKFADNIAINKGTRQTATTVITADEPSALITVQGGNQQQEAEMTDQTVMEAKQKTVLQQENEKAWLENYAFYNKSTRKKWKDRMAFELYVTPSASYRMLRGNAQFDPASALASSPATNGNDISSAVNHTPGLGLDAGIGMVYSAARNIRIKGGLQLNFTNYNIHADKTSHPVLTTLLLNDANTGASYISSAVSTIANSNTLQPTILHNRTYQLSLPVGVAMKLYGNNKIEWYAGASIQPSFILGGKSYLISSDRKNYIEDASFMRKWNINTGIETYLSINLGSVNLQAGPQFRYQFYSTYNKLYTNTEKLYNVGMKIGILKNF